VHTFSVYFSIEISPNLMQKYKSFKIYDLDFLFVRKQCCFDIFQGLNDLNCMQIWMACQLTLFLLAFVFKSISNPNPSPPFHFSKKKKKKTLFKTIIILFLLFFHKSQHLISPLYYINYFLLLKQKNSQQKGLPNTPNILYH
jgi:hypothetical protein